MEVEASFGTVLKFSVARDGFSAVAIALSHERAAYYRYLFVPGTTIEPLFALTALGITLPNAGSAAGATWNV